MNIFALIVAFCAVVFGVITVFKQQTRLFYKIVVFLIIFSLPLLINIVTWTIHINCIKSKEDNKVFCAFWITQGLMSLGMIIYMCIQLYG